MPDTLPTPDAPIIAGLGQPGVHYAGGEGDGQPVSIVQDDSYRPRTQSTATFKVFFCQPLASGFLVNPKQNDHIVFQTQRFRIFETEEDTGGGTEATRGIYLLCVRIPT